jgi:hypothetical protein
MCLSILPILGWFCIGGGALLGIAALVTGFIGMNKIKQSAEKGRGMAIAGIVLGALAMVGICAWVIITIVAGPVIGNVFSQITNFVPTTAP